MVFLLMKLNFFFFRGELLIRAGLGDGEVSSSAAWNQSARHRPPCGPRKADAILVAAPSRFLRTLLFVPLFLLALCHGSADAASKDFADLFKRGIDAEDGGRLDDALQYYSDAIKMEGGSARLWAKRGEVYLKKGEPNTAIKDLAKAVRLDPGYAEAFTRLGFAYNAINAYDDAILALDYAIKLAPMSSEALNTRGFSYNGKSDFDKAVVDFDQAIRLNANDARYYNNRGFALNGKHEYRKALKDFDKAIELDSKNPMFYNNRGVAYMKERQFDEALQDFEKAISLNSGFTSAYHNRGMAYSGKGRDDKAIEEFSKVIEMTPDSPVPYKDRGTAYYKLRDFEPAIKDFEKAISLDKNFAPAYAALGLVKATATRSDREAKAGLLLAEKAVKMTRGTSPDMLEQLARVQHALGDKAGAVRTLQKAIETDPKNQEYVALLAKWGGSAPRTATPSVSRPEAADNRGLW